VGRRTRSQSSHASFVARVAAERVTEREAVEFLERLRGWDRKPRCVRCGDTNVYRMRSRSGHRNARFLWRCRGCNSQYTVRAATLFEDSRVALRDWCATLHAACRSKQGVSSTDISRRTGVTNATALFMIDRIRTALDSVERAHKGQEAGVPLGRVADRLKLRGKSMTAMRRALNSPRSEHGWAE